MGTNYKQTHIDILNSAKENFLKNGFERSNLRKICKDAHITTGAFYRHFSDKEAVFIELVEPVINKLKDMYNISEKEYYEILDAKDVEKIWQMNEDSLVPFIEFIYDHYTEMKLLLMCSDGTKYGGFLHKLSSVETKKTRKYIEAIKAKGYQIADIDDKEIHMLIQAYFSSIFEIVMHDYPKEDALAYSKTLIKFFNPGWRVVLGL
ncbi:MAG: TetR/AcrR family transcriptional regulator [Marinisporobacter sp.]|nr:TetR/AcrR family transcriptional regulator [Marinisporobacter sp.]